MKKFLIIGTVAALMFAAIGTAHAASGEITNPPADGMSLSGVVTFTATYDDTNLDVDVNWAIRDACDGSVTYFGNVDGKNDDFEFEIGEFSATLDLSSLEPGDYCFIFNPEDPGEGTSEDVRVTRTFIIEEEVEEPTAPVEKSECANGGWRTFTDPVFKNQGQCVAYVAKMQGDGDADTQKGPKKGR